MEEETELGLTVAVFKTQLVANFLRSVLEKSEGRT